MADPVVGWLVVVAGPGRGAVRAIGAGFNTIGRETGHNRIALDFGDSNISREKHAIIVYDDAPDKRAFTIKHEEGQNLTRVRGNAVTDFTPLVSGDEIALGATTVRFVALCGPDFDWSDGR